MKKAWRRIRLAWYADQRRHDGPPIWTIFHIGKRVYHCRQFGLQIIFGTPKGKFTQQVQGKLPEKMDLLAMQNAIRLLDVELVLDG